MSEQKAPVPMPRFDFSQCEIKDDEQLEAKIAEQALGGKYFEPGKYDVVVDDVEFTGLSEKDPTWGNLQVTLKGTNDRTIKSFIMIPFKEVTYGEKKTMFVFRQFRTFCSALGVTVTRANLEETMKTVFAKPERLKGTALSIEVGYQKGYVKYAGKSEDGGAKYTIHTQDGNPVCGPDQRPLIFPDRAAANNYAIENGIAIDKFPRVLSYTASASGLAAQQVSW